MAHGKTGGASDLLHHEATPGVLLILAAATALVLDNSGFSSVYDQLLGTKFSIALGDLGLAKPLLLWINDGLMAIFFLLVGLEIKREILGGRLSRWRDASLPVFAALGGMAVPALIYAGVNADDPEALTGWAIPAATDIAFALGVLALLGSRVPTAIKVFLLALAVLDDLGAIVIIAAFYTSDLSVAALGLGAVCLVLLFALNRLGVTRLGPYMLIGVVLWVCVLKSGVHATLAGVVVAFAIPLRAENKAGRSPATWLEGMIHPWSAFFIMPIFAFANAGVSLAGIGFGDLLRPIPLGIALGLFVGKQLGVFLVAWGAVRFGIASLPAGATWRQIHGAAVLAGIGFTMSLFIGTLAFVDPAHAADVRVGVLAGSCISAIAGYLLLRLATEKAAGGPVSSADRPA